MQKFKIAKKWDEKLSKFDGYKIEEREKVITGKLALSKKVKDTYENYSVPFIVFKNKVTQETIDAVLSLEFWAEDSQISFYSFLNDKGKTQKGIQIIINQAFPLNQTTKQPTKKDLDSIGLDLDDEIPF